MSLPRYSEYKSSGVEWLGEVPGHWEVWKLSHAFDVIGSGTTPKSDNTAYYDDGQTAWVNTGDLNDGDLFDCEKRVTDLALVEHSSLKIFPSGSLVIAMYGATIGKLAMLQFPAAVNQACCVFVEGVQVQSKFLFYWFTGLRQQIISLATGGGQPNISQEILRGLRLACPTHSEQQTIATFLDRETGKIDALIAEQQRLVTLLAEKRQAVISHAVTKGLNPNARMKDSGIAWLGEVPEHWEVLSIRRIATSVQTGGTPSSQPPSLELEEGVVWYTPGDFDTSIRLGDSSRKITSEVAESGEANMFPAGSVLVVSIGATLGKVGYIDKPSSANQQINAIVPNETVDGYFLTYSLLVKGEVMRFLSNASTIGIMNQEKTKDIWLAVPPRVEQQTIAIFLDTETAKFDTLTAEANRAIALLQERRSALISAAVTVKIDVREFA